MNKKKCFFIHMGAFFLNGQSVKFSPRGGIFSVCVWRGGGHFWACPPDIFLRDQPFVTFFFTDQIFLISPDRGGFNFF